MPNLRWSNELVLWVSNWHHRANLFSRSRDSEFTFYPSSAWMIADRSIQSSQFLNTVNSPLFCFSMIFFSYFSYSNFDMVVLLWLLCFQCSCSYTPSMFVPSTAPRVEAFTTIVAMLLSFNFSWFRTLVLFCRGVYMKQSDWDILEQLSPVTSCASQFSLWYLHIWYSSRRSVSISFHYSAVPLSLDCCVDFLVMPASKAGLSTWKWSFARRSGNIRANP